MHFSSPFSLSFLAFLTKISHVGMDSRPSVRTGRMNVPVRTHGHKPLCVCVCKYVLIQIVLLYTYYLATWFLLLNSMSWEYFRGTTNCFISFHNTAASYGMLWIVIFHPFTDGCLRVSYMPPLINNAIT